MPQHTANHAGLSAGVVSIIRGVMEDLEGRLPTRQEAARDLSVGIKQAECIQFLVTTFCAPVSFSRFVVTHVEPPASLCHFTGNTQPPRVDSSPPQPYIPSF